MANPFTSLGPDGHSFTGRWCERRLWKHYSPLATRITDMCDRQPEGWRGRVAGWVSVALGTGNFFS